jgi:hypothetical protein
MPNAPSAPPPISNILRRVSSSMCELLLESHGMIL